MINLFQHKPRRYRTPAGQLYTLFDDMAAQPHLLVAGATGSGKSVVVNGIIYNLLHKGPAEAELILIDPKRVELVQYRNVPHCLRYASEPDTMPDALRYALTVTESRYKEMQRQGVRKYTGGDVYVIIDELADLMTTQKKAVLPLLQRLCQIGRAAKVHVIACTHCPKNNKTKPGISGMVYLVYFYLFIYYIIIYIQLYRKIKNIYLAAHGLLLPWKPVPVGKLYGMTQAERRTQFRRNTPCRSRRNDSKQNGTAQPGRHVPG